MDKKPLIGLAGVIVAAMSAEFNDLVGSNAMVDVRGALGIGHDTGIWIESLYLSGMVIGMAISPWWSAAVTLRRTVLFAIALNLVSTALIPFAPDVTCFLVLRAVQGLAEGLTIPLLMTTALKYLTPNIRLYGLSCYALTATFFPNLSAAVSALWTDVVGWRFVFFEAIPMCTLAALCVWYGMPQDPPHYERLRKYDWPGTLLVVVGLGALTTMLQHGSRLDWFNSKLICTLALISAVAIPLLVVNEWKQELPLFKPQLLKRRNFAYGVVTLFSFVIIGMSASTVPSEYLIEVQGFRPLQTYSLMAEVAALQLVFLPLLVKVLDLEWVDSRWINGLGLLCLIAACVGSSMLDSTWSREQFYLWQAISGFGQACVVLSLLMMATNVVAPPEGPFASPLVNMPRGLSEVVGLCILELMAHFRGQLHATRLLESAGTRRFSVIEASGIDPRHLPPLLPDGAQRAAGSLSAFSHAIDVQRATMVISDDYLLLAALAAVVFAVLLVLPQRTWPPRIALLKKSST
ncbi:MFS transporter [Burkholderia sp. WAC0059]|uniref:MFS transporter n=1 Tax=Burkholderia sp. WAC0059 TaxID=2066022 RepID=UPI000C7ECAF4|nr:MFS transporter [Burkholderia sp. WAC0059]PLZ02692.1 MFS transporter [Burkholderia sp. WAC0059]